ncbi:TlpA family protein disulfide reductase [Kaarinaea lacus]
MKSKYIIMLVTFVAGIWIGNQAIRHLTNQPEAERAVEAMLDKKIPEFTLPDLDGVKHSISQWQGDVIVLNFWATWCPPCRKETPMFVELQQELGAQGLQFIGVAIDEPSAVQDFVDTYGVNYPMLIGAEDAIQIARSYGNRFDSLPYTVIIDRSGHIAHIQRTELERSVAETTIKKLL